MDEATGWCEGCLRTLDEIALWSVLDDDDKRAVWQLLRAAPALRLQRRLPRGRPGGAAMKRIVLLVRRRSRRSPSWPSSACRRRWQGCSYEVEYRPRAVRRPAAALGPEGPGRDRAQARLDLPPRALAGAAARHRAATRRRVHPFNPLPLLRLALACGPEGGAEPCVRGAVPPCLAWAAPMRSDPQRLAALHGRARAGARPGGRRGQGRAAPRTPTRRCAQGIFGVPTFELDGRLFWGLDALPMLRGALRGDPWFDGPAWDAAAVAPPGVTQALSVAPADAPGRAGA